MKPRIPNLRSSKHLPAGSPSALFTEVNDEKLEIIVQVFENQDSPTQLTHKALDVGPQDSREIRIEEENAGGYCEFIRGYSLDDSRLKFIVLARWTKFVIGAWMV